LTWSGTNKQIFSAVASGLSIVRECKFNVCLSKLVILVSLFATDSVSKSILIDNSVIHDKSINVERYSTEPIGHSLLIQRESLFNLRK
jgi:hypothetical protein